MASRRVLMTANNTYIQPMKTSLGCKVVFTMCQFYHSIILSKKFRFKDPRIDELFNKTRNNKLYCEYLDITKADE